MVIGNGLLASAFAEYISDPDILFFASGVSNSLEENDEKFRREEDLLLKMLKQEINVRMIYFSTYSIFYKQSKYTQHKTKMEELVLDYQPKALIARVTNVVGKSHNPNTLLNYFIHGVRHELPITLYDGTKRNLIDVEDLKQVVIALLHRNDIIQNIVNIGYPFSYSTTEIVSYIESFLNKKAILYRQPANESIQENYFDIASLDGLSIREKNEYLPYLLQTYYNPT